MSGLDDDKVDFAALFSDMLQRFRDKGRIEVAFKVVHEGAERGLTPIGAVWDLRLDDRIAPRILTELELEHKMVPEGFPDIDQEFFREMWDPPYKEGYRTGYAAGVCLCALRLMHAKVKGVSRPSKPYKTSDSKMTLPPRSSRSMRLAGMGPQSARYDCGG